MDHPLENIDFRPFETLDLHFGKLFGTCVRWVIHKSDRPLLDDAPSLGFSLLYIHNLWGSTSVH